MQGPDRGNDSGRSWPVDGHVHFHDLALVPSMLDAAAINFGRVESGGATPSGALLLAQASSEKVFESLQRMPGIGNWRIVPVPEEPQTLLAKRGETVLAIVCGRQVRADDGLEVLALGTGRTFQDGLPFLESVESVRQSDALTVLPWGVGKWLGRRGSLVDAAAHAIGREQLFIGDNGGRLRLMGMPRRIHRFERRGIRVLPGTDPFPFGSDLRRVGRFGFLAELQPAWISPWRQLRDWLTSLAASPRPYGRALGPLTFLFNQVGIRVRSGRMDSRPS